MGDGVGDGVGDGAGDGIEAGGTTSATQAVSNISDITIKASSRSFITSPYDGKCFAFRWLAMSNHQGYWCFLSPPLVPLLGQE